MGISFIIKILHSIVMIAIFTHMHIIRVHTFSFYDYITVKIMYDLKWKGVCILERFINRTPYLIRQFLLGSSWSSIVPSDNQQPICGIRLYTGSLPCVIQYQTLHADHGWLPEKYSYENSFSGKIGSSIQAVSMKHTGISPGNHPGRDMILLYRIKSSSGWFPWNSNADLETLQCLQKEKRLGGSLPSGDYQEQFVMKGITNLDIRLYQDKAYSSSQTPLCFSPGGIEAAEIQQEYMKDSVWNAFKEEEPPGIMHGIRLYTPDKPYYLRYRTYNKEIGWFPYVSSHIPDYSGRAGREVEAIQIQLFDHDGKKLHTKHVVMYRACVEGIWLPWISNASVEIMERIQLAHGLEGEVSDIFAFTGYPASGKPINDLEVRIYEYVSTVSG